MIAADIMRKDVITVDHSLVITRHGRLAGIVTSMDVMRAFVTLATDLRGASATAWTSIAARFIRSPMILPDPFGCPARRNLV